MIPFRFSLRPQHFVRAIRSGLCPAARPANIDLSMRSTDDAELLEAWRDRGDRAAMDELVRRNIHFVYGAARRQVRDAAWAEDVTQAVFMLLIRKSPRLSSESAVAVWLHPAARYASANARRMRQRQTRARMPVPAARRAGVRANAGAGVPRADPGAG